MFRNYRAGLKIAAGSVEGNTVSILRRRVMAAQILRRTRAACKFSVLINRCKITTGFIHKQILRQSKMAVAQSGEKSVALVTGASSGIGLVCAQRLQQRGYQVYGASRHIAPSVAPHIHCLSMNVDDDESVRRSVAQIIETKARIDVVINCAGYGVAGAIEDTSIEEIRAQFETNLFGVVRVCQHVLPTMRQQKSGLIINVSSLAGLTALPFQGIYSASKFALEGMTESMRMEVAPFGIRVVLIEPGDFATGFTGQRRRAAAAHALSPYHVECEKALGRMAHDETHGSHPEIIAALIERIIATPAPRLRYSAGLMAQRFGVALKPFLSQKFYEKMLMRMYGLR